MSTVGHKEKDTTGIAVSVQNAHDIEKVLGDATPGHVAYSPEQAKKVLRKIDMALMPLMCITVLLQFLDKTSLNYANLLGVQKSLGLKGQQYSWLGSVFYIVWLFASPIHGYFLQKFNIAKYVAGIIFVWGGVLACHAACTNYTGLVAVRLILGILEGGITPAFILLTGRFYTRAEQVSRTGIWFLQNGTAQILGGVISWSLLNRKQSSTAKIELWQELFLILGCITMVYGVVLALFMPESPSTYKLLSEEEKRVAVERIRDSRPGNNSKKFERKQLWEAVKDVRIYLFALGVCSANIANGGVSNFGSAIIAGFGYSRPKTALLGMTTGASEIVAVLLGIAIAAKTKTRFIPGVFSFMIAIIGAIMMIAIPAHNTTARMAGYALVFFYPVASPFYYSWLSSLGGVGNIIGPQTYQSKDSPGYVSAKITLIAMFAVSSLCLIGISTVHLFENRKRDRAGEFGQGEPVDIEFSDATDKEVRSFRYPY